MNEAAVESEAIWLGGDQRAAKALIDQNPEQDKQDKQAEQAEGQASRAA
jgi:hypothetical protein